MQKNKEKGKNVFRKKCIEFIFRTAKRQVLLKSNELEVEKSNIRQSSSQRPDVKLCRL